MPTVGKKKYPYTKAGKAAAASAKKAGARVGKATKKAGAKKATRVLKNKATKKKIKKAIIGAGSFLAQGPVKVAKLAAKTAKDKKAKSRAGSAVIGGVAGAGAGKLVRAGQKAAMKKRLPKGALKRTPAQIARIKAGGRNATRRRKAGRGTQR